MSGRWVPACRPFRRLLFRTAMSADPGTISESDRVTSAVTRSNTSCRRAYRSVPVSIASTLRVCRVRTAKRHFIVFVLLRSALLVPCENRSVCDTRRVCRRRNTTCYALTCEEVVFPRRGV